jgi:hypothetical protein
LSALEIFDINFGQQLKTKTSNMENRNEGNKKVLTALIILLLITNAITAYLLFTTNREKTDVTTQKVALENDFKMLNDTLDAKRAELDQFRGKNAELDSVITLRQQQIDDQKKTISNLFAKGKMTASELKKAKDMIAQYESSIADMKKQVEELTAQNQQLTTQNTQLTTDLTAEKQATTQLTEVNKGLSKKVELGSLLQLRNVEVVAIKKKGSGKEVEVSRAKVAESLRISFETGENKVLEPGNLKLYVRIINPKGETIAVTDQGSGSLKMAESEQEIQFTKQADFDYSQTNKKVVIYWSQNINNPGTYKVEVYQSGYVVGLGQVTLK